MHKTISAQLKEEKSQRTKRALPDDLSHNPSKSAKIQQVLPRSSISGNRFISQEKADDLIVKYVVNEMRPLRTVESDSFRVLVTGLNSAVTVMCCKTLHVILKNKYDSMLHTLKSELSSTRYICTTADIWSSAHRSFLGMTAHWFGTDSDGNLLRKSAALACMRFKGKHSYDHIAAGISQTHARYDIEGKFRRHAPIMVPI